ALTRSAFSAKSGGGKKISPYNKFVQQELARLKIESPEISHTERFKLAAQNWKKSKETATTK
ncbi:hypothetical protein M422DRAFT_175451, partial [Sphaerobolus stellatus SS14]